MATIVRISGGKSIKQTLLWTNPNTMTGFRNDTTIFDLTGYDYVLSTYKRYKDDTDDIFYTNIAKLDGNSCMPFGAFTESGVYITRTFILTGTDWKIANCFDSSGVGRFNYIIPLKVYGLKGQMEE